VGVAMINAVFDGIDPDHNLDPGQITGAITGG
jgi:hypothetical protein